MSGAWVPRALARAVRRRAGDACEYCLLPQESQESAFHLDHIRPRSALGRTQLENLALACVGCSLKKAAQQRGTDPLTGDRVRLYNPRNDVWSQHFGWTSRWTIIGLTRVGRATIVALDLNRARLLQIRRELAKLKRFPPTKSDG